MKPVSKAIAITLLITLLLSIPGVRADAALSNLKQPKWTIEINNAQEEQPVVTWADLAPKDKVPYVVNPSPYDKPAMQAAVNEMVRKGEKTLTLQYDTAPSEEDVQAILDSVSQYVYTNGFQLGNASTFSRIRVSPDGSVYIEDFHNSLYEQAGIENAEQTVLQAACAVRAKLIEEGSITENMSETGKAKAYFEAIAELYNYDYATCAADYQEHGYVTGDTATQLFQKAGGDANSTFTKDLASYTAYGVFVNGKAVCAGATEAYNIMLALEGIQCECYSPHEGHVRTKAILDGTPTFIDVTWGGQDDVVRWEFFGMDEFE